MTGADLDQVIAEATSGLSDDRRQLVGALLRRVAEESFLDGHASAIHHISTYGKSNLLVNLTETAEGCTVRDGAEGVAS
jgi:hypothetical protein